MWFCVSGGPDVMCPDRTSHKLIRHKAVNEPINHEEESTTAAVNECFTGCVPSQLSALQPSLGLKGRCRVSASSVCVGKQCIVGIFSQKAFHIQWMLYVSFTSCRMFFQLLRPRLGQQVALKHQDTLQGVGKGREEEDTRC